MNIFTNRREAGQLLSGLLASRRYARPVVLALSSGGVPVGYEIARALGAPLGLLSSTPTGGEAPVRRWSPELARRALDPALEPRRDPRGPGIERDQEGVPECSCSSLRRVEGPRLEVAGCTVILADEWVACAEPVVSGLSDLRRRRPRRIVLATPVAPLDAGPVLERAFDEVFCLSRPEHGADPATSYSNPEQITDASVIALLDRAALPGRGS